MDSNTILQNKCDKTCIGFSKNNDSALEKGKKKGHYSALMNTNE